MPSLDEERPKPTTEFKSTNGIFSLGSFIINTFHKINVPSAGQQWPEFIVDRLGKLEGV
jgi:hypothetical protein